jgi:hypothetical protein
MMAFGLTSTAFVHGDTIPKKYSCDGEDVSPPLQWSDPPPGTQSFALIVDDPDARGTWDHWLIFNLPAGTLILPEAVPTEGDLPDGSKQGHNSWQKLGYGGPCPPRGPHRYYFKLYALDTVIDLTAGATKEKLLQAIEGRILAQTELMGKYTRR